MDIVCWITLFSTIGTLALAIAAFVSIRYNRIVQKREYRHRLLNEIIEWATNVTKYAFEKGFSEVVSASNTGRLQLSVWRHIVEVEESFKATRARNHYVGKIARGFGQGLQKTVEELVQNLEAYINFLDEWQHVMANDMAMDIADNAEQADAHQQTLDKLANNVIEEAAKIKIKDIR